VTSTGCGEPAIASRYRKTAIRLGVWVTTSANASREGGASLNVLSGLVAGNFSGYWMGLAIIILMAIAFDLKTSLRFFSIRANALMAASGVFIYTGTGVLCALLGGLFLDYSAMDALLALGPVEWRSMGVFIVELGVGLAVTAIMASLFWDLSSGGDMEKGL
jgi:multicomponent Na+:H+ antiporter subunit B